MKIANIKRCIVIIGALLLIECALIGYIGWWRSPFWEAVNNRDLSTFIRYIGYFSIAALTACYVSSKNLYMQQYLALIYRHNLTRRALKIKGSLIEGHSQRIQEDCFKYPLLLISLIVGFIRNIILVGVFIYILVSQLGISYLLYPILYAIIGTLIAAKLARPLINLNYVVQAIEAKFRQTLSKLDYARVHRQNHKIMRSTKHLGYFQYFYNQITVIIPYIVLAPIYFSATIVFGVFMQCASSMNQIIECFSYMINSFNDINKFLSCKRRLKELGLI